MPVDQISNAQTLSLPSPPASVRGWRVGTILQATVVETSPSGSATLQIGGTRVQALSAQSLQPGTRLSLRVVSLQPQPTLQRLDSTDPAIEARNGALRAALPKQDGLAPLLANLGEIAQGGPAQALLPREIVERLSTLLQTLPTQAQVSTETGLKNAIENSGLFLESRLAASARDPSLPPPINDFKGALLRLASLLGTPGGKPGGGNGIPPPTHGAAPAAQAPAAPSLAHASTSSHALTELGHQVDAALARIEVGQISIASHNAANANPYWTIELPVQTGDSSDVLQLRIEREPRGPDPGEPEAWTLTLAMHPHGLGPLYARISFAQGRVGTRLWAERAATHQLIEHYAPVLEQNLTKAGLQVSGISCAHGTPPGNKASPAADPGLVDLQV